MQNVEVAAGNSSHLADASSAPRYSSPLSLSPPLRSPREQAGIGRLGSQTLGCDQGQGSPDLRALLRIGRNHRVRAEARWESGDYGIWKLRDQEAGGARLAGSAYGEGDEHQGVHRAGLPRKPGAAGSA